MSATFTIDYINYSTSGNNATIVGVLNPPSNWNLVIPETVTNASIVYNVTSIGNDAFRNKTQIISVTIGNLVTTIGTYAFSGCNQITSVLISNSVTSIGEGAFYACIKLRTINIPNLLQVIEAYTFRGCENLENLIFPASITTINYSATFYCYRLKNVVFLGLVPIIVNENFEGGNPPATENVLYNVGLNVDNPNLSTLNSFFSTINNIPNPPVPNLNIDDIFPPVLNSNICFLKGTPVRTDQGLIHIDKINPDVHTIRNKKIVAITKTNTRDKYLVCFEKDSLGPKMPSEKTIITYNHKILYNGKMIKAKHFIENFENVHDVNYNGELLYNVLLEEPSKMIVNNLICETLHPDNLIAQIYRFLPNMNLKEQDELITRINKDAIFAFNN